MNINLNVFVFHFSSTVVTISLLLAFWGYALFAFLILAWFYLYAQIQLFIFLAMKIMLFLKLISLTHLSFNFQMLFFVLLLSVDRRVEHCPSAYYLAWIYLSYFNAFGVSCLTPIYILTISFLSSLNHFCFVNHLFHLNVLKQPPIH